MKSLKMLFGCKIVALLILTSFAFASCSKDDEPTTPAYVGTWQEQTFEAAAPTVNVVALNLYRTVLVLEETAYTKKSESKRVDATEWRVNYIEKGSLSIANNVMTRVSLKRSIGFDPINLEETNVVYGDIDVDDRVTLYEQWSVSNNELTLILDLNDDEKFDEVNDAAIVYTRL